MLSLEEKYASIRLKWAGRLFRNDADQDEEVPAAPPKKSGSGGGHGNTSLPYGIAKGEGIDTHGMSPKEVWEALEGKGYSAKAAYAAIKEGKTGAAVGAAAKTASSSNAPHPGFESAGDKKYHVGKKDWDKDLLNKMPEGTTITIPEYQIPGGPKVPEKSYQFNDGKWDDLKNGGSFYPSSEHVKEGFFDSKVADACDYGKGFIEIQYPEDGYVSPSKKKAAAEKQKKEAEAAQMKSEVLAKIQKKGWNEVSEDKYSISPKEAGGSILAAMPEGTKIDIPGMGTATKYSKDTLKVVNGKNSQLISSATLSTKMKKNGEQLELSLPNTGDKNLKAEKSKDTENSSISYLQNENKKTSNPISQKSSDVNFITGNEKKSGPLIPGFAPNNPNAPWNKKPEKTYIQNQNSSKQKSEPSEGKVPEAQTTKFTPTGFNEKVAKVGDNILYQKDPWKLETGKVTKVTDSAYAGEKSYYIDDGSKSGKFAGNAIAINGYLIPGTEIEIPNLGGHYQKAKVVEFQPGKYGDGYRLEQTKNGKKTYTNVTIDYLEKANPQFKGKLAGKKVG